MKDLNIILSVLFIILFFIFILLILKIYLLKQSIKEIKNCFDYILNSDTNNIISISSNDKNIRDLAFSINKNIIELRIQKLQYNNGNQNFKKLITNISHDLRTPLTVINGYVDLLLKDQQYKKHYKYLDIIQKKTNELVELTNQLFSFTQMLDVNVQNKKDNCCINTILEETLVNYYPIFKEKNIVPTILICKNKIYKIIDKMALIRIFDNILSNISKYSNGNFRIELKENGMIIFSNNAPFLDSTTVQKIFDRYFSVENAKESTGIGLSIAKELVELNNGHIFADYINNTLFIKINFN